MIVSGDDDRFVLESFAGIPSSTRPELFSALMAGLQETRPDPRFARFAELVNYQDYH